MLLVLLVEGESLLINREPLDLMRDGENYAQYVPAQSPRSAATRTRVKSVVDNGLGRSKICA